MAERVSHLKLFQEVHYLGLRIQHVFSAELAQANFHAEPVGLVQGAPVCLMARFLNQVTLAIECEFIKADQELEAA